MNQISSLKSLNCDFKHSIEDQNIPFVSFPGAGNCLADLSEFRCYANVCPENVYQLSKICHNIQTLIIIIDDDVPGELKTFISSQKKLKSLGLKVHNEDFREILPDLKKHRGTLTKLHIANYHKDGIFTFIASFVNLQELVIQSFYIHHELQYMIFSNLKTFRIVGMNGSTNPGILKTFFENNGKNLIDLYINRYLDNSINLSIVRYCPNLKNLLITIEKSESSTLKIIFNSCQHLESIKVWCGDRYIDEKEMLKIVANDSPKNLYSLKLSNWKISKLLPEELESFFLSWGSRTPQKPLNLIVSKDITNCGFDTNEENIQVVNKYKRLGIVKEFKTENDDIEKYLYN